MVSTTHPLIQSNVNPHKSFWEESRHKLSTFLSTRFGNHDQQTPSMLPHFGSTTHSVHDETILKRITELAKDYHRFHVDRKSDGDGLHGGYMVKRGTRRQDDEQFSLAALFGPYGILDAMTPKLHQAPKITLSPEVKHAVHDTWNRLIANPIKSMVWNPTTPANT